MFCCHFGNLGVNQSCQFWQLWLTKVADFGNFALDKFCRIWKFSQIARYGNSFGRKIPISGKA